MVVAAIAIALVLVTACSDDVADTDEAEVLTTEDAQDDVTDAQAPPSDDAEDHGEDEAIPVLPDDVALPIVFVHGFAGSAQQFESQAMRFVANGYSQERIVAYDHDGAGLDFDAYAAGVEAVVEQTLDDFGVDEVYLVGHSRGTVVSSTYLTELGGAEQVARYVAIDGAPCPDVVPCIEVTQESIPGQAHVEVATSKESFAAQFEFLVGEAPEVVDIVPQDGSVTISGRAVNFPSNTGREGATLDIWRVDAATGARTEAEPHATFELGADGDFGPVGLEVGAHYEYVLSTPDSPNQHHLYLQPYLRDSHLVRLLSSPPDGPTRVNTNTGDDHASLVVMRMREWFADGDHRDVLTIATEHAGGSEGPVDVMDVDFVGNGAIGLHLHDGEAAPGTSTLEPLPYFADQPFQSGIDVFMPASESGDGLITVTNLPRGDADSPQVLNVPNWPSSLHAISVVFSDFAVD